MQAFQYMRLLSGLPFIFLTHSHRCTFSNKCLYYIEMCTSLFFLLLCRFVCTILCMCFPLKDLSMSIVNLIVTVKCTHSKSSITFTGMDIELVNKDRLHLIFISVITHTHTYTIYIQNHKIRNKPPSNLRIQGESIYVHRLTNTK